MDVAVDRAGEDVVLDPGIDRRQPRIVLEHRIEVGTGVHLEHALQRQGSSHLDLGGVQAMLVQVDLLSRHQFDQMLVAHKGLLSGSWSRYSI
jgi:hypothetical protein